jgi:hypothetical protein
MHKWYIVALAALAVLLLVAGMFALIVPDAYEGPEIYRIDRTHAIRVLDLAGAMLLLVGCTIAWTAGLVWQWSTHDA